MELSKTTTLSSGQGLIIRPYQLTDYAQVRAILLEAKMFDQTWDCEESLRRMITEQPQSILVATVNDKVVGSVYILVAGFWVQIYRLAVLKEYRKQGIGSALMDAAETNLRHKGVPEASLFYNSDHSWLGEFYVKRGWQGSSRLFRCLWKKL